MTGTQCSAALFLVAICASTPDAARPTPPPDVLVTVVDGVRNQSIAGARVFVLSDTDGELASGVTDKYGNCHLPALSADKKPTFVLVEHNSYFIGGLRWQQASREYYIVLSLFVLR